ncbi:hypothetical protein E4K10_00150 [Streptomyces sp. T1317-0309]|nr:hypothetical protein E4K10_00150 [Streptomyces sp. T1317-0309]
MEHRLLLGATLPPNQRLPLRDEQRADLEVLNLPTFTHVQQDCSADGFAERRNFEDLALKQVAASCSTERRLMKVQERSTSVTF